MQNVTYPARIIRAAQACQACQAVEDVRYCLNGILLAANGDVVSTDGHRLFKSTNDVAIDETVIVQLHNQVPKTATQVHFDFSAKQAMITRDLVKGGTKTIKVIPFNIVDGEFPDYNRAIPDELNCEGVPHLNAMYLAEAGTFGTVGNYCGVTIEHNDEHQVVIKPTASLWPAGTVMVIMQMRQ